MENSNQPPMKFTTYHKIVVALLAFLQFTIILDFMIISPLGAAVMPALKINPSQFGLVVSAYAFSAGLSGILAAGFADKFDRKKLLMFFYIGFIIGTLFCGLANSYEALLIARIVTGLFGGVIGSIVLAITTDIFPLQMRGRVMGIIQTAFAASQILGIPVGLYLSNHWGWHIPFMMIVAISILAAFVIWFYLNPIDGHLKLQHEGHSPLYHLWLTLKNPKYIIAYLTTALLTTGGYMLMPFGSAFSVNNLGVSLTDLPLVYLITGLFTIMIGPLVGKISDTFGQFKTFIFGALMTILMVVIYTHMSVSPLWLVILVNVLLFIGIFSRVIPAQALTSATPSQAQRGSFMAVNASLQQVSGGIASVIAGLIVVETVAGKIENFEIIGYILVATTLISIYTVRRIEKNVQKQIANHDALLMH
ncbi:MAG: MFS transporter [Pseudobdellovibrio sp.]